MNLKEVFQKRKNHLVVKKLSKEINECGRTDGKPEVPDGLLKKCNFCKAAILAEEVRQNNYICPECHGYFRMHANRRIEMIADEGSFEEWDEKLSTVNPLGYKGYEEKIDSLQEKTGLNEAVVIGKARIHGEETVLGVCDGRFLMASMGHIVGEKITRAVERATKERLPVILFACSGGARMQEGMVSLMQMSKTAAALRRHSDEGNLYISVLTDPTTGGVTASFAMLGDIILAEPNALIGFAGPRVIEQTIGQKYISVLTDPTTGGVTASFAMLGDIILAEPNALIGFAGPRVIEQTIGQKLPKGFQRSEFLLEHGFIDGIAERGEMKELLGKLLRLHKACPKETGEIIAMPEEEKITVLHSGKKTPWEKVLASRAKDRPSGSVYIRSLFTDFVEMHGDRYFGDDKAILAGIASFEGRPVTVIAQEKGNSTKENIAHNFGMASPEGYRKALRMMKQAEKFGRPVICFVDTPGAFCGIEAEERGQGEAIARNLFEMAGLKVPVLTIVTGEGGSGGALALASGDEVWMLENAVYSILSPEGFAAILWKDSKRAKEAAKVMKLTAEDLKEMGMIEQIIDEPEVLSGENVELVCETLREEMNKFLVKYSNLDVEKLLEQRYERFRKF